MWCVWMRQACAYNFTAVRGHPILEGTRGFMEGKYSKRR